MGKRCPACRKPVAQDAVLCTNCGYDRRTRGRVIRRPDDESETAPPHALAFLWSPSAVALAFLTFWGFFFYAAAKNPSLIIPYRTAVLTVVIAAAAVMLFRIVTSGMDWEEWVLFLFRPEYFLFRSEFEGYTQVVLLTGILAALGIPFLLATRAAATGVGP